MIKEWRFDTWQLTREVFLVSEMLTMVLRPTQPLIQWVPGALSLQMKGPGCEPDH